MSVLARLHNLLHGWLGNWIQHRERRHPGAVYEAAIRRRVAQYGKLRQAAAGVLYMRGKISGELEQRTAMLAHLHEELARAVDGDDDPVALLLIERKATLDAEIARLAAELTDVTAEAETAKQNLISFRSGIAELRDEKVVMLTKWANARARRRLQETMNGLESSEADIAALAEVREHIHRVVSEAQLVRELGDAGLEQRLGAIRDAQAAEAARSQLLELKRARKQPLLPVVLSAAS